ISACCHETAWAASSARANSPSGSRPRRMRGPSCSNRWAAPAWTMISRRSFMLEDFQKETLLAQLELATDVQGGLGDPQPGPVERLEVLHKPAALGVAVHAGVQRADQRIVHRDRAHVWVA